MVWIHPSFATSVKGSQTPFLGKNCPLFSNCVLVLKCPFWCAVRLVADSSIFYNILTWPSKKLPFPCLSPKYFWKSVLVCKIKEPANHCSEEKGRGGNHTKPQDSNKNVLETYVTQRPCHLQAARPKHPCQPQWVAPALRDHVTPETAVVAAVGDPWLENSWDHSESSS